MKLQRIQHHFVEFIPEKLESGTLYISLEYNSASHLCACGCGNEVVTIFGPADSSITYNGRGVTISTSIGNSNFPCKSHYWISDNHILWESRMTPQLTALSRAKDKAVKAKEYDQSSPDVALSVPASIVQDPPPFARGSNHEKKSKPWWSSLLGL